MQLISITPQTALLVMKYANAGLFYLSDHEVILIDTGHMHESRALLKFLEERALIVRYIINTHGHIDHIGGNFLLQEHFNCPIAMPYIDNIYCEDITRYYMSFSTSAVEGLAIYGDDTFDVETLIKDQETLEVLGHTFQLAATPGHTYNHKAVVTPDGICFLGDGLMNDVTLETAKFAVVTNLNRHFETIEFIRRLPYRQFILGHGAHIYNPEELAALCGRNRQYFEQKYREILRLLTPEKTFDSLMHTLGAQYGLRRNLFKYYVAERSIKAVLSYLESVGAIRIHVVGGVLTYTTLNQPQKSDVQRASYS